MAITPNTIAEKLVSINNSKVDIASAIEEKGGTVPQLFSGYGDAIRALPYKFPCEIEELPVEDSDATFALFFNLDGQVVACISKDEVQSLTELPEVPDESESGLINGTWNWTLEQLKAAEHPVSVGPQYDTEDGGTWLKIETPKDNHEFGFNLPSQQSIRNLMTVDWGDGTVEQAPPANPTHAYTTAGNYTVKIGMKSANWSVQLFGNTATWLDVSYRVCVKEINFGYYFTFSQQGAASGLVNLKRLSVPTSHPASFVTFYGPYSENPAIKQVTVPTGCTNYAIGGSASNYHRDYSLGVVCLPGTITGNANPAMTYTPGFKLWRNQAKANITPATYGSLLVYELADNATLPVFNTTTSLRKVVFPANPTTTITTIPNNGFSRCFLLEELENFDWSKLTTIGGYGVYQCANLKLPEVLELPALTSFGGVVAMAEVPHLIEIVIGTVGNTVNMGGNQIFQTCVNLRKVTFLSQPNTIPAQTFSNCYSLEVVDFSNCTSVPTLANVNAFANTPNKKIIVPDALYDTWIAATNWSSTTNNIVGSIVKASEA